MDLYDDTFLYDLAHGPLADPGVAKFYKDACLEFRGPTLELACGTGNVLIPVAQAGIDVRGLDISDSMLKTCRRKAGDLGLRLKVEIGDMRSFDLDTKFSLIYIAGNSFQHLDTTRDVIACFECVRKHLQPDGRVLIEISNPYVPLLVREIGRRFVVGEFDDYVLTEDVMYDAATQKSSFSWHFWHRPTDKIKTLYFSLRQFFPQEFDALFELNGFKIEHKFGDLDRSEFTSSSPSQITIASLA